MRHPWIGLATLSLISGFASAAQQPTDVDTLRALIAAQQDQIELQQQQLDAQRKQLDAFRRELDALQKGTAPQKTVPPAAPVVQAAAEPPTSPGVTPVSAAISQVDILRQDVNGAPRLDNAPLDPAMKGFIPIPGTYSRFRIGGYAKLDVIHDFRPAGEADSFITSAIPVGHQPGNAQNTFFSVRPTDLSLDFRRPTSKGDLRIFIENDFYASSNATNFHLRNAYGQLWNLLGGYTLTAIADPDSIPDTLDYEGPNGLVYLRQPQIRFTLPLDRAKKHTLAFSIEQGTSDIWTSPRAGAPGAPAVTPTSPWPDGIVRYRYEGEKGHFQAGAVFRSIGGYTALLPDTHVFGWGVSVAGGLQAGERDHFFYQFSGGQGMGRYVQDVTGLGADVGLDRRGRLVPLTIYGGFVSYQHYWSATLRSSLAFGYVQLDSEGHSFTTDYTRTNYGAANLIWNPAGTSLNVGVEYLYGNHFVTTGESGFAHRLQFSVQYDLLRLK